MIAAAKGSKLLDLTITAYLSFDMISPNKGMLCQLLNSITCCETYTYKCAYILSVSERNKDESAE